MIRFNRNLRLNGLSLQSAARAIMPKAVISVRQHLGAVFQPVDFLAGVVLGDILIGLHLLDQQRRGSAGCILPSGEDLHLTHDLFRLLPE